MGVRPRELHRASLALSAAMTATVDHIVDHMVPVDRSTRLLLPLDLLEPPADEVPVTGT